MFGLELPHLLPWDLLSRFLTLPADPKTSQCLYVYNHRSQFLIINLFTHTQYTHTHTHTHSPCYMYLSTRTIFPDKEKLFLAKVFVWSSPTWNCPSLHNNEALWRYLAHLSSLAMRSYSLVISAYANRPTAGVPGVYGDHLLGPVLSTAEYSCGLFCAFELLSAGVKHNHSGKIDFIVCWLYD